MATIKTLGKGQVVIPAEIRRKYGIEPGSKLQIVEYGGIIYLIPPVESPVASAVGILPSKPSMAEKLLAERKKDYNP